MPCPTAHSHECLAETEPRSLGLKAQAEGQLSWSLAAALCWPWHHSNLPIQSLLSLLRAYLPPCLASLGTGFPLPIDTGSYNQPCHEHCLAQLPLLQGRRRLHSTDPWQELRTFGHHCYYQESRRLLQTHPASPGARAGCGLRTRQGPFSLNSGTEKWLYMVLQV